MLKEIINWINKIVKPKKTISETFNLQKLTALHEAAHVVCAYLSEYHSLVARVCLNSDTTGETFVSLSRNKILSKQKVATEHSNKDPEIVIDAAIIFYAGFEAERIYCKKTNYIEDVSHSLNDYNHVENLFENANPPVIIDMEEIKKLSQKIINFHWNAVEDIADKLVQAKCIESSEILEYLKNGFGK